MNILVTGGAGFIGSNLVRLLVTTTEHSVLNVDALTYAGNRHSLDDLEQNPRYRFAQADICDATAMGKLFAEFQPDWVMHLAAESHVDRSIDGPGAFIQTNVVGTFNLLQAARGHFEKLTGAAKDRFRFLHVSTDEVYGSLGATGLFTEETPYDPHSPYSASKASSDLLVRAYHHTYHLPAVITNCSNNYGPYQFPEKLIPVVIQKLLARQSIPVYGQGLNIRDWLFVRDHAEALWTVLRTGKLGETYNIGGNNEKTNIDIVGQICDLIDELRPDLGGGSRALISYVTDRPGHDFRYAIDASKIKRELGWEPAYTFERGIRETVQWYLDHQPWVTAVTAKK